MAQLGSSLASSVLRKVEARFARTIEAFYSPTAPGFVAHYHRSPRYWIRAMDFEQYFKSATRRRSVHHFRDLRFANEIDGKAVCAIINSSFFFFWFMTVCNGRNLTTADVASFPVGDFEPAVRQRLCQAFDDLMSDYQGICRKATSGSHQGQSFRQCRRAYGPGSPILGSFPLPLIVRVWRDGNRIDGWLALGNEWPNPIPSVDPT